MLRENILKEEMFSACRNGDLNKVQEILEENSDILHFQNDVNRTPVMISAMHNEHELTEYLIKMGADPGERDIFGYNTFHYLDHPVSDEETQSILNAISSSKNDAPDTDDE